MTYNPFEALNIPRTGNSMFNTNAVQPTAPVLPMSNVNTDYLNYTGDRPNFNFGLPESGINPAPSIGDIGAASSLSEEGPSFWEGLVGSKKFGPGWGNLAVKGITGAGNLWLGLENLKLGKESLRTSKDQFNKQYDTQRQLINQDIRDRGHARYQGSGRTGQTAEEYYEANRLR